MTRVAFLWHMHQPYYEDLVTREHILPWVRLHALKDYYGMVALLEEFPSVRMTFNLVPSLLVQLEAFAADRAHDQYLELGMKPAESLSPEDVRFILRNFFHAQRHHMIDAYPRYGELLALRGEIGTPTELESAARRFSLDELRDLQVWQKLAWLDPYYLERDPRVTDLLSRGRHFTEGDKVTLRQVELELLRAVIPAYRARALASQIEISASPFYHPILPLLCDTDIYKQTHPQSAMPRHRFMHPEDAAEQLERAAACHERLFGARPVGLWPSEGSVSDAMVPLVEKAGFRWMATDELILARTLGTSFVRDDRGRVNQPERLYQSYRLTARGGEVLAWVRSLPGSQRLRALVVFDEVYGFLPPHPQNPPTKRPLVALMKQARAFGVGVVVATQNPMDLDYRALSNAGIWCVGRLQTDADRARVMDGLAASIGTDKAATAALARTVQRLAPRWFVIRDAHVNNGIALLQPRWAMSLLRGPMTRTELKRAREDHAKVIGRPLPVVTTPSVERANQPLLEPHASKSVSPFSAEGLQHGA